MHMFVHELSVVCPQMVISAASINTSHLFVSSIPLQCLQITMWHTFLNCLAVREDSPIKKSRMCTLVADSILFPNRPGLNCQSCPVVVHMPTTHTRCIWCTISLAGEQSCHFSPAGNNILSFPKNMSFKSKCHATEWTLALQCRNLPRLNGICPWKLIGALQLSIFCLEPLQRLSDRDEGNFWNAYKKEATNFKRTFKRSTISNISLLAIIGCSITKIICIWCSEGNDTMVIQTQDFTPTIYHSTYRESDT